jgi:hypothetical protein
MAHGSTRARHGGLVSRQPLGELVGLRFAFLREPMKVADNLLLVELACQLTVPFGQLAEELCGFLHDMAGSGKLHLSDAKF